MFLSRSIAGALSLLIAGKPLAAQDTPRDTVHKKDTVPVPMNMPMGEKTQKKPDKNRPKIDSMATPARPVMPGMDTSIKRADSTRKPMPGMGADDLMIGPAGVSMERMGSGTTWIPDAVSLPSRRRMLDTWMVMAHGFVFAQYERQDG